MPHQNRVEPNGTIVAVAARGLFMGNRGGRLHDDDGRLGRARWRTKAWLVCATHFKDRRREVMGEGYTELFFLDEVTALAAGHRPCFECRRAEAIAFADRVPGAGRTRAHEIDRRLHRERRGRGPRIAGSDLPEGAMAADERGQFLARHGARLLAWSHEGYEDGGPADTRMLTLLTPATTCGALARGYVPVWHPTAHAMIPVLAAV